MCVNISHNVVRYFLDSDPAQLANTVMWFSVPVGIRVDIPTVEILCIVDLRCLKRRKRNYKNLLNRRNPVALPKLTDEQRKEALAKAAEARKARAELKEQLKRGDITLKEVLAKASSDEIIGKTKVSALLESLPKVGKVKAKEIMDELEIAQTRRLRGLGDRQRRALLERFGFSED